VFWYSLIICLTFLVYAILPLVCWHFLLVTGIAQGKELNQQSFELYNLRESIDNAVIKSLSGRFGEAYLDQKWFLSFQDAVKIVDDSGCI
jgi:hypothetical protein